MAAAILSVASWPWLFAINVPLGLMTLWMGRKALPSNPVVRKDGEPIAALDVLLNILMFTLLFLGGEQLGVRMGQGAAGSGYGLVDLLAYYPLTENVRLNLNLNNVFDKDPIQLSRRRAQDDSGNVGQPFTPNNTHYGLTQATEYTALPGYLGVLARLFETMGLEDLVNRRTEIVKLVVPLQGLTRRHPLVGFLQEDAMDQTEAWGVNPLLTAGGALGPLGTLPQAEELAGLIARIGLDMLPRHFVVYVKQRLVLLDLLFYVLEILEFLFKFLSTFMALAGGTIVYGTLKTLVGIRPSTQSRRSSPTTASRSMGAENVTVDPLMQDWP